MAFNRTAPKARVGPEDVERNLVCLRDVLQETLPPEMREVVGPYLEAALQTLAAAPTALPSFLEGKERRSVSGLVDRSVAIVGGPSAKSNASAVGLSGLLRSIG